MGDRKNVSQHESRVAGQKINLQKRCFMTVAFAFNFKKSYFNN